MSNLWESGSEVSQFIPEPRNFAEVTRLPADIKKSLIEIKFKTYEKLNQQSDLYNGIPREGRASDTMHVWIQVKIQSYGSLDKLKLRTLIIGDFQNK